MNTLINCFVPKGIEEETKRNVEALGSLDLVGEVAVVDAMSATPRQFTTLPTRPVPPIRSSF